MSSFSSTRSLEVFHSAVLAQKVLLWEEQRNMQRLVSNNIFVRILGFSEPVIKVTLSYLNRDALGSICKNA